MAPFRAASSASKAFAAARSGSQGEPRHRGDPHSGSGHRPGGERDPGAVHADGREPVLHGLLAELRISRPVASGLSSVWSIMPASSSSMNPSSAMSSLSTGTGHPSNPESGVPTIIAYAGFGAPGAAGPAQEVDPQDERPSRGTREDAEEPGSGAPAESLTVTDHRTGRTYDIPIDDGTIRATDLRQIKVGGRRLRAGRLRPRRS